MSFEDGTRAVRTGEELDQGKLAAYLSRELGEELVDIEQFPGGHSNLTYLVKLRGRELVLRRPPFGSKVKRAHDMSREHRVLSRLTEHKRWAPRPVLFCGDHEVIGSDFYLMERIRGVILRKKVPEGIHIDEVTARRLSETLFDTLIELHGVDYQAVGLADLGQPDGYVARQVSGWTKRYADSRTDDIREMPAVADWLAAHMPPSPAPTIIHNDYKFDNVIYDSERFERIVGVLDWEMTTIGDPLMDLGTSLCYWVEPGDPDELKAFTFGPTLLPGMLGREELCQRYAERTGRDTSNIVFYFVFGLFKTAVVLQQIYYRYKQGLTHDPRFPFLIDGVKLLAKLADGAIRSGRL